MSADAPRSKQFVLADHEARVLEWIACRLPARVLPDHLTALGVLAAFGSSRTATRHGSGRRPPC
jgi:hypothetical protein